MDDVHPIRPDHLHICLPVRWRRRADLDHGVLVAARAPTVPLSGVRPELVLRCTPVEEPLVVWRDDAMRELATVLVDFELEDGDEYDLLAHPVAYRRFAHRVGAADLLCDQWAWASDGIGIGITLTCSVAREDYPDYCDVFEAVAETVDLMPDAA